MIDVDKCRITRYPAAVLGQPAAPVEKIDETIRRLVEKMTDIMIENKGMGLAAPQAGVGLRLFIISMDGSREQVRAYVNPTVTPAGDLEENGEGCLSVPGIYPKIRRYKRATVTATDLDGHEFTEEADGLYARCLQHESDHLDGMTIVNRMGAAAKIANRRQIKKLIDKHEGK
ncbi:MAG: peptide deformylase [Sedimentisphaerales bacterium]|jgi:peptide deformylase|nr:peptide deformylase [Sedimentisphaerales bacterium]HNY80501.1 peptide deformylase [Sedimentisphaerales bacterium]HOC65163.1 peptide deformylase [Sedimentisphaerales bacterium]HOH66165.1 peptide deformylase [Sedimentisphaerales bacterium]HPY50222.1 peptide deformylase [Sedimentisphaerales bacterium]